MGSGEVGVERDEDDEAYAARLEPAMPKAILPDRLAEEGAVAVVEARGQHSSLKPDEFVALSVFGSELSGVQIMRTTAAAGNPVGPAAASAPSNSKKKSKAGSGEATGEPGEPSSVAVAPRPGAPADLSLTDARPAQVSSRTVFKTSKAGPQGTVLNLRVRKADVDAFAKDENLETFKSKAVFNSYIGNGYGILSINSWAGSARGK
jgi:hypothetical protein